MWRLERRSMSGSGLGGLVASDEGRGDGGGSGVGVGEVDGDRAGGLNGEGKSQ